LPWRILVFHPPPKHIQPERAAASIVPLIWPIFPGHAEIKQSMPAAFGEKRILVRAYAIPRKTRSIAVHTMCNRYKFTCCSRLRLAKSN